MRVPWHMGTDAPWNCLAKNPYDGTYYGETAKMLGYPVTSGNHWPA